MTIEHPRLWQPGRPALYSLSLSAATEKGEKALSTYRLSFGVRKLETRRGVLYLNGRRLRCAARASTRTTSGRGPP